MDATLTGLIDSIKGWINKIFEFFGLYTSKYAGWILGLIALWILSKIFKVRIGGAAR